MTDSTRHHPDDPRPEAATRSAPPPSEQWDELFADLEGWPGLDGGSADDATARLLDAWSLVDTDVAVAGPDLAVELALAASSRRPSPLLTAVGRLVDAGPAGSPGCDVYVAAFRRPVVRLAIFLGRRTGTDAAIWYVPLHDDLLAATHELVVFGTLLSGRAVVERARARALWRLDGAGTTPSRVAVRCALARLRERAEAAVHDLCSPDLVDRVLQRLVPLDAVVLLEAMVEDGTELKEACRALGLWRRPARRQLSAYRTARPLYEADARRLASQVAAVEIGGHR